MKLTIRLRDDIHAAAKAEARATGKTLSQLVSEALREHLERRRHRLHRERVILPTFKGDGLLPGVDLHRNADLLDVMDDRASAR